MVNTERKKSNVKNSKRFGKKDISRVERPFLHGAVPDQQERKNCWRYRILATSVRNTSTQRMAMMKKLFNSVFDYLCAIGDTLYEYRQLDRRHYY
jgi:hypothetical protein